MSRQEKLANQAFFENMLNCIKDGGQYMWPQMGYVYNVEDGKFVAPLQEIKAIAKITPKAFHKNLKIAK